MTELTWNVLLAPMSLLGYVFIPFPYVALVPAIVFILLFRKTRNLFCLVTGILWLVYGVYEYGMMARILCSGECNIRVDLLLIYPLLLVMTCIAGLAAYLARRRQRLP